MRRTNNNDGGGDDKATPLLMKTSNEKDDDATAQTTDPDHVDDDGEKEEEVQLTLADCCCGAVVCLVACALNLVSCACVSFLCCCAGTVSAADSAAHRMKGERWDTVTDQWVIDDLETEAETLRGAPTDDADVLRPENNGGGAASATAADAAAAAASVKDTALYDLLGVPANVGASELRKAYYVRAREWHPDRNSSEEAKTKFQEIGEAYRVLSDDKLRRVYDREGKDGVDRNDDPAAASLDPTEVFTFLFGNDQFGDVVGRLTLVTRQMAEAAGQDASDPAVATEIERRRVLRLALALRERVRLFVEGDAEAARTAWRTEGERLVEALYGEEILNVVGRTYESVATQMVGSLTEAASARRRTMREQWGAMREAVAAASTAKASADSGHLEDVLPSMMGVAWSVTVMDITGTIKEVVTKLCKDISVSKDVRHKRAEAVRELGTLWAELKSKSTKEGGEGGDASGDDRKKKKFADATAAAMKAHLDKLNKDEASKNAAAAAVAATGVDE